MIRGSALVLVRACRKLEAERASYPRVLLVHHAPTSDVQQRVLLTAIPIPSLTETKRKRCQVDMTKRAHENIFATNIFLYVPAPALLRTRHGYSENE